MDDRDLTEFNQIDQFCGYNIDLTQVISIDFAREVFLPYIILCFKVYFTPGGIFRTESRFRDDVAKKSLRIVYIKSIAHSVYHHHSLI